MAIRSTVAMASKAQKHLSFKPSEPAIARGQKRPKCQMLKPCYCDFLQHQCVKLDTKGNCPYSH